MQALTLGVFRDMKQLWDPRKAGEIRSYDHHFDFISDFMWTEAKKELVVTR